MCKKTELEKFVHTSKWDGGVGVVVGDGGHYFLPIAHENAAGEQIKAVVDDVKHLNWIANAEVALLAIVDVVEFVFLQHKCDR